MLVFGLDGYLEVIVGNAIIWRGSRLDLAVESYNSVTEKYIYLVKNFKL
jgi:hypothetical protein